MSAEAPKTTAQVIAAVEQAALPVLRAHGVVPFEIALRRERGGWTLRVMVERETGEPGEGITVDVCADISRDLSAALDVADPVPHAYNLEVSTPGIERPLRGAADFTRFAGRHAKVVLFEPLADGQAGLRGQLVGVEGEELVMQIASKQVRVPTTSIKLAHLVFELPSQPKKKHEPKQKVRPSTGR